MPAIYKIYRDALKHSARANVWTSTGTVIAKPKNRRTLKLDIYTTVTDVFRNALAGHENVDKVDLLDSRRLEHDMQELTVIREKRMGEVLLPSRARWIAVGEKTIKYFCGLKKRDYVS